MYIYARLAWLISWLGKKWKLHAGYLYLASKLVLLVHTQYYMWNAERFITFTKNIVCWERKPHSRLNSSSRASLLKSTLKTYFDLLITQNQPLCLNILMNILIEIDDRLWLIVSKEGVCVCVCVCIVHVHVGEHRFPDIVNILLYLTLLHCIMHCTLPMHKHMYTCTYIGMLFLVWTTSGSSFLPLPPCTNCSAQHFTTNTHIQVWAFPCYIYNCISSTYNVHSCHCRLMLCYNVYHNSTCIPWCMLAASGSTFVSLPLNTITSTVLVNIHVHATNM